MLLGNGSNVQTVSPIVLTTTLFFLFRPIILGLLITCSGEAIRAATIGLTYISGIGNTFAQMQFNGSRWIFKEYNTLAIWLAGITLILLLKYPQITNHNEDAKYVILMVVLVLLAVAYGVTRYMKKSGSKLKVSNN